MMHSNTNGLRVFLCYSKSSVVSRLINWGLSSFVFLRFSFIIILIWLGDWFLIITDQSASPAVLLVAVSLTTTSRCLLVNSLNNLLSLYDFCFVFFFVFNSPANNSTMNIFSVKRKWQGLIMAIAVKEELNWSKNERTKEREEAELRTNQSCNSIERVSIYKNL